MTRGLLSFLFVALLAVALIRAGMPRGRSEVHEHQFLRRRVEWLTVAFALVGGLLAVGCIRALPIGRPPNPLGMIAYVLLCVVAAAAWKVLRPAWRRVGAARRAHQDALTSAAGGPSVLDVPPARHRGLSGQEEPPNRW